MRSFKTLTMYRIYPIVSNKTGTEITTFLMPRVYKVETQETL
jgi:hypothetical protein